MAVLVVKGTVRLVTVILITVRWYYSWWHLFSGGESMWIGYFGKMNLGEGTQNIYPI